MANAVARGVAAAMAGVAGIMAGEVVNKVTACTATATIITVVRGCCGCH